MIGSNGGLIGDARTSRDGLAVGVWKLNEQVVFKRQSTWINDPSFDNVSLLLRMDGNNGSTTFLDSSRNLLTVTANGNAQINTAQSKFGGGSAFFDGNGDFLSLADSALWDFPSNFTVEAWVYLTAYSNAYLGNYGAAIVANYQSGSGNIGWQLRINGTATQYNTINFYTGVTDINFAVSPISLNQWMHVAVCRSGSSMRAFLNGVQAGNTVTNNDSLTESGGRSLYIGALNDNNFRFWLNGYIDELRITKGVARYTANFTTPIAPFPNA